MTFRSYSLSGSLSSRRTGDVRADPHQNASRCTVDWGSRNAVGPGKSHKSGLSIPPMERDVSESEKSGFSAALTVGQQLDLNLPDSRAVRDAYEQAQAESQPWLFNHVARSWLYGAKLAHHRALKPDAELVAVSALLHDLGLARGGATDRRFEI